MTEVFGGGQLLAESRQHHQQHQPRDRHCEQADHPAPADGRSRPYAAVLRLAHRLQLWLWLWLDPRGPQVTVGLGLVQRVVQQTGPVGAAVVRQQVDLVRLSGGRSSGSANGCSGVVSDSSANRAATLAASAGRSAGSVAMSSASS